MMESLPHCHEIFGKCLSQSNIPLYIWYSVARILIIIANACLGYSHGLLWTMGPFTKPQTTHSGKKNWSRLPGGFSLNRILHQRGVYANRISIAYGFGDLRILSLLFDIPIHHIWSWLVLWIGYIWLECKRSYNNLLHCLIFYVTTIILCRISYCK